MRISPRFGNGYLHCSPYPLQSLGGYGFIGSVRGGYSKTGGNYWGGDASIEGMEDERVAVRG